MPVPPLVLAGGSLTVRNEAMLLERYPRLLIARGAGEPTIADAIGYFHGDRELASIRGIGYRGAPHRGVVALGRRARRTAVAPNRVQRDFLPELDLLDATFACNGVAQLEISRGCTSHCSFGEDTDPASLLPIHERLEQPGSTYVLHHTSVHTVQAEADTISLLIRGPSAKQRFLIFDAATGGFFWVYGAAQESSEQRASKRLTPDQLDHTITRIQRLIADLDPVSRSASLDGR